MADVSISVRGAHEERLPAEEGIARVSVRVEHADRRAIVEVLAAAADPVRDGLRTRHQNHDVVAWTSSRATVWTDRPWGPDGTRLAPVHHATIDVEATFSDPAILSTWLDELAEQSAVQIDGVTWQLTERTASEARDRVAQAAVRDAVARAEAYAAALGLPEVTPNAVADAGLLSPEAPSPGPMMLRASTANDGAISLRPDDVTVAVTVEARFSAR